MVRARVSSKTACTSLNTDPATGANHSSAPETSAAPRPSTFLLVSPPHCRVVYMLGSGAPNASGGLSPTRTLLPPQLAASRTPPL